MKYAGVILEIVKIFFVFITCTILFYVALLWVNEEYENYHRYQEPTGAVKVQHIQEEQPTLIDRVIYFYENGE